eukprot:scaffold36901_cov37-Prasinocladus_malaysianus.AAC.3
MLARLSDVEARLDKAPAAAAAGARSPAAIRSIKAVMPPSRAITRANSGSLDRFQMHLAAASRRPVASEPIAGWSSTLAMSIASTKSLTAPETATAVMASLLWWVRQARDRAALARLSRGLSLSLVSRSSSVTTPCIEPSEVSSLSAPFAACRALSVPVLAAMARPSMAPLRIIYQINRAQSVSAGREARMILSSIFM